MTEAQFQRQVKQVVKERFPGCYVYKTDSQQLQGSPDLLILYKDKWAALELKRNAKATHRPNQDYRVQQMNEMSFAAFVYPENLQEVLDDMARSFEA